MAEKVLYPKSGINENNVEKIYLSTDLNIKAEQVQEKENSADKKAKIDIKKLYCVNG